MAQIKRGLPSSWTNQNPVLSAGEFGVEKGTNLVKIGDGTTAWNSLPYLPPSAHTHVKADVGLSAVDNTSDIDKPVSTLQQTALDGMAKSTGALRADIELPATPVDGDVLYFETASGKVKTKTVTGGGGATLVLDYAHTADIQSISFAAENGLYKLGGFLKTAGDNCYISLSSDDGATYMTFTSGSMITGSFSNGNVFGGAGGFGADYLSFGAGWGYGVGLYADLSLILKDNIMTVNGFTSHTAANGGVSPLGGSVICPSPINRIRIIVNGTDKIRAGSFFKAWKVA